MLELNKEYYWKRTDGWDWFGTQRWWEIFIVPTGYNGVGGLWLLERWRWNGSSQTIREEVRTLSHAESQQIVKEVMENGKQAQARQ